VQLLLGGLDVELCYEVVNHKVFGRGKIVDFENNYITVLFDESKTEKKFTYPSAFGAFLELENKSFLKEIQEDKDEIDKMEAEKQKIKEEEAKVMLNMKFKENGVRRLKNSPSKSSDKNNIAFKCNHCDGENGKEILGFYEATKSEFSKCIYAGRQTSEINEDKGKPMSLRNVKANSLAILTTKLPYTKDEDRFVFAVFITDENYEVNSKSDGYVGANPKYKIQLTLEEARKVKFWDFYFNANKPERIIFGSGLHRYITDVQASQVLKKIWEIKKDTSEEEHSRVMLEYYCGIKKLNIDEIPMPNGALQRNIS